MTTQAHLYKVGDLLKVPSEQGEGCKHPSLPPVLFDAEKARTMTDSEIRHAYPRSVSDCPDCQCKVIRYASLEHYIAGDW